MKNYELCNRKLPQRYKLFLLANQEDLEKLLCLSDKFSTCANDFFNAEDAEFERVEKSLFPLRSLR